AGIGPDAAGEDRMHEADAAVDVGDHDSFAIDGGIFGDELIEVHLLVVSAPGEEPALLQVLDREIHNPLGARSALFGVPHTSASFPAWEVARLRCRALEMARANQGDGFGGLCRYRPRLASRRS